MKKQIKEKKGSLYKEPYIIINFCFACVVILILLYSGIFSADKNNHPIKSACANYPGQICKSEGLSRSFSEIVRLRFDSARKYNSQGVKIFMFFFIQLWLRFLFSFLILKKINSTLLIFTDGFLSVALYLYSFWYIIHI